MYLLCICVCIYIYIYIVHMTCNLYILKEVSAEKDDSFILYSSQGK